MISTALKRLKTWAINDKKSSELSIVSHDSYENTITPRHAHPQQKLDHQQLLFAPTPNLVPSMVQYALNHWVYTAVNELTSIAASAEFMITSRPDGMEINHQHPLAGLLGKYGQPNRDTDSFEWWESHFQNLIITGNSYWLWESDTQGPPTRIRMLEPQNMRIRPGIKETVGKYVYFANGKWVEYEPEQITHFKRANPFSRYYGLSALAVLYRLVVGDSEMLEWNNDFFDNELGIPSGIFIVPADTPDDDIKRYRDEFTAKHGEKRRIAFVKADAGKAVWLEAGLKHKDYDFKDGRTLNRKAVLEGIGVSLGYMAETSTEAHAVVSERRMMKTVRVWHTRSTRKLNIDGLPFWAQTSKWQTDFEDVRKSAVDWRRDKLRRDADEKILSLEEMRMREYKLGDIDGQTVAQLTASKAVNNSGDEATNPNDDPDD